MQTLFNLKQSIQREFVQHIAKQAQCDVREMYDDKDFNNVALLCVDVVGTQQQLNVLDIVFEKLQMYAY